jgi:GAF domain-containing protein
MNKEPSKKTSVKRRAAPSAESIAKLKQTIASQAREIREGAEQQAAMREILRMIATAPGNLQAVLDAVAECAARLCDANDAQIFRLESDLVHRVGTFGDLPVALEHTPYNRETPIGRAMIDRQIVHIRDLSDVVDREFPVMKSHQQSIGQRTTLAVPLARDGISIGAILIRRLEVRPFSDTQIKLLETFADQAVIAIENARLFQELTEALERQTATSDILGVIASSPTDLQPVLDAVAETAARVCGASDALIRRVDGNVLTLMAHYGPIPGLGAGDPIPLNRGSVNGCAVIDRQTIHIHDLAAEPENAFPVGSALAQRFGYRTILVTPLLREGVAIGTVLIRRTEVRPFTDSQIKLLETFADQAVIAIENVRLFKELQERNRDLTEALEQQTATSEVLKVISRSAFDLQPVFEAIVRSAAQLCEATFAVIHRFDGQLVTFEAHHGLTQLEVEAARRRFPRPADRETAVGRAILDRRITHIHDIRADPEYNWRSHGEQMEFRRTVLAVPLLREGKPVGAMGLWRRDVRPFSEKQIKLIETFADQAVIAIENVRLFRELEDRNRQITESLEQQTATSEILRVIASSPTDIQPVLDVVAENAARLCDSNDAQLRLIDESGLRLTASYGSFPSPVPEIAPICRQLLTGRAVIDRQMIHVHDLEPGRETEYPEAPRDGTRTALAMPLLREGLPIGAILIRRLEVRPFSEKQIALLRTFADQAVIAIENVRLFQELEARTRELARSVEELKALGEVGQTVSSTLDLQTVLSTMVGHAVQLSGTSGGMIYEYDEPTQEFHLRASYRMEEELAEAYRVAPLRIGQGATGRSAATRVPMQVVNLMNEPELGAARIRPILARLGYQSLLAVPLLLEQRIMGALTVYRRETGSFAPEIVNLLRTFATQSVLAIQNARLFREIEDKSRQIEAANRHKSEFLANMSHELRTPLNAIIGFSEVLGERLFGELNEKQAEYTDDILSSGRHLLSLINEILDLSKVEAGRMELELATFDLPLAIDNARTFVRERATKHGIALDVTIDERLGSSWGMSARSSRYFSICFPTR